jgi:hypothetical protein
MKREMKEKKEIERAAGCWKRDEEIKKQETRKGTGCWAGKKQKERE